MDDLEVESCIEKVSKDDQRLQFRAIGVLGDGVAMSCQ